MNVPMPQKIISAEFFIDFWEKYSSKLIEDTSWVEKWDSNTQWTQYVMGEKKSVTKGAKIGEEFIKYFDSKVERSGELNYRMEDGKVDMSVFYNNYISLISRSNGYYPEIKQGYPLSYPLLLEHENDIHDSWREIMKLCYYKTPLKVLITYHTDNISNRERFNERKMLQDNVVLALRSTTSTSQYWDQFLIIIGQKSNNKLIWSYDTVLANGVLINNRYQQFSQLLGVSNSGFITFASSSGGFKVVDQLISELSQFKKVLFLNYKNNTPEKMAEFQSLNFNSGSLLFKSGLLESEKTFFRDLEKLIRESSAETVLIDGLGDILHGVNNNLSKTQIISNLKDMANDLSLQIILNYEVSNKDHGSNRELELKHLKWSNNLVEESDQIFGLYCPEYYGIVEDELGNRLEGVIIVEGLKGGCSVIYLKNETGKFLTKLRANGHR